MEQAKLDALIHGKHQCVSFRHASALLSIPARSAQKLLHNYVQSQPAHTLTVLWVVSQRDQNTGVVRTVLTTTPSSTANKQIWAVGPNTAASAPSQHAVWIADDANRERELTKKPSHEPNSLRDGRYNVVQSSTSVLDSRIDPRLGGDPKLASAQKEGSEKKSAPTSLLSLVRSKSKGKKGSKQAPFSFKNAASTNGGGSTTKSTGANLFASKPLGAGSIRKIKEEERAKATEKQHENKPTSSRNRTSSKASRPSTTNRKQRNTKKARRVVIQPESDDSDGAESADEVDEEQQQMKQLEREAAEQERADAERAELEQELMDLNRQGADEPESPQLQDLQDEEMKDVDDTPKHDDKPSESPNKGKRTFWEAVNQKPTSGRRVRKEVEELVEEKGYYVTRRVIKIFDENGNEVKEDSDGDAKMDTDETPKKSKIDNNGRSLRNLLTPLKSKNSQRLTNGSRLRDKSVKPSSPTKTTQKRKNKSITSYFRKKV